jgi:integrase
MTDKSLQNVAPNKQIASFSLNVNDTLDAWLKKSAKSSSPRARDIRNDKRKAITEFFDWFGRSPEMVQSADVVKWLDKLTMRDLAPLTIYNRFLALTHYFEYLRSDTGFLEAIPENPVKDVMLKSPRRNLKKNVEALTNSELSKLLSVVENHSLSGKPLFLRDYAILQLFVITGRRRQEIIGLTGEHIKVKKDSLIIRLKLSGGYYTGFELKDEKVRTALFEYLKATGRSQHIFGTPKPLWLRHDNGAKGSKNLPLTAHSFARRMKIYADEAGIRNFHIHKLRHTYATILAEEFQSLDEAQEILGYASLDGARFYIKRLKVLKDKFSGSIRQAMKEAAR